ncbi:hypothetical protein STXM2123_5674 [Streptomyces sp. F-3]|nr:hypothetical protein STXM2123_5674 [Streptomyces sp. F-3]
MRGHSGSGGGAGGGALRIRHRCRLLSMRLRVWCCGSKRRFPLNVCISTILRDFYRAYIPADSRRFPSRSVLGHLSTASAVRQDFVKDASRSGEGV